MTSESFQLCQKPKKVCFITFIYKSYMLLEAIELIDQFNYWSDRVVRFMEENFFPRLLYI